MDFQEAIEYMRKESHKQCVNSEEQDAYIITISAMQKLQEYKKIGTLKEIREAVEKQRAKGPTYAGDGYAPDGTFVWDEWLCPRCGSRFEIDFDDYDYCPNCGQHIDWSEEDEQS